MTNERKTLEQLAQAVADAPMRQRWEANQALRMYMRERLEGQLIQEIQNLKNPDLAGKLVGAGLSARMQDALIQRVKELRGA